MANSCDLCNKGIRYDVDEWKITVTTYSNYNSREREYTFHQSCYEQGKSQLIGAVANADCLSATIRFDKRDAEYSMDKAQARNAHIQRGVDAISQSTAAVAPIFLGLAIVLLVVAVPIFFLQGWFCWLGIIPLSLALGLLWLWWICR